MAHRLAPQARAEHSRIWSYIVEESGNVAAADDVVDAIAGRFHLLSQCPRMGRSRDDLRPPKSVLVGSKTSIDKDSMGQRRQARLGTVGPSSLGMEGTNAPPYERID